MAYEVIGFKTGTLVAAADLSTHQYKFVKLNTTGGVVLATTAGEKVIGVLQNKPLAGQPCEIVHLGICSVLANAALANTGPIMTAATGKAATAATTGSTIVGHLLEAAGADGDVVSAFINCGVGVV